MLLDRDGADLGRSSEVERRREEPLIQSF